MTKSMILIVSLGLSANLQAAPPVGGMGMGNGPGGVSAIAPGGMGGAMGAVPSTPGVLPPGIAGMITNLPPGLANRPLPAGLSGINRLTNPNTPARP